jgi:hypothetical protein
MSVPPCPQPLWGWSVKNNTGKLGNGPNDQVPNCDQSASQCGSGADPSAPPGFACPHQMLLSPDMKFAAIADGNDWAHYGMVGAAGDQQCGKCYQLQYVAPSNDHEYAAGFGVTAGGLPPRPLVVQVGNSGGDVKQGQFDVYMGAGGFGWYNAVSSDCATQEPPCGGGVCSTNQFGGSSEDFMLGYGCYGGGIAMDHLVDKNISPEDACAAAFPGTEWSAQVARQSCVEGVRAKYHWGWDVAYKEVDCPENLTRLTGMRRSDNEGLPPPSPDLLAGDAANGNTTTMQDGCKPSCAWSGKVKTIEGNWKCISSCGKDGIPYFDKNPPAPPAPPATGCSDCTGDKQCFAPAPWSECRSASRAECDGWGYTWCG